jgi:hypothetical protein
VKQSELVAGLRRMLLEEIERCHDDEIINRSIPFADEVQVKLSHIQQAIQRTNTPAEFSDVLWDVVGGNDPDFIQVFDESGVQVY